MVVEASAKIEILGRGFIVTLIVPFVVQPRFVTSTE